MNFLWVSLSLASAASMITPADAHPPDFKVVHLFCRELSCPDGANPISPRLLAYHGKLYGTTYLGGAGRVGTIFTMNMRTEAEQAVHSFSETDPNEGANPIAGVTNVDGVFYGATRNGGLYEVGTLFSFDPATRATKVLYSFNNEFGQYHYFPQGSLVAVNSVLYGTTVGGGSGNYGTIFSYDLNSGTENIVYSFSGHADGGIPEAGLIDSSHALFGTTFNGGVHSWGVVFKLDLTNGSESVVHSFPGNARDGVSPQAGVIDVNGILYGTTTKGGRHNAGSIFSVDPVSGHERVLYSFCRRQNCTDGESPGADLLAVNGVLYGTTMTGGRYGWGTVFSFPLDSGVETIIHSFNKLDGATPMGPLTAADGKLFGTTSRGGIDDRGGDCLQYGCGTVFSIEL